MVQLDEDNLLDFLAEGFLQEGASVTFKIISGIAALQVTAEDGRPGLYISAEEDVSKMALLEQHISEEILVPVLKSEEELQLKAALAGSEITRIKVFRLSITQRYAWYTRKYLKSKANKSASAGKFQSL